MPKITITNPRVTKDGNHLTADFSTADARYHVNLNAETRKVLPNRPLGSSRPERPTLFKNCPLSVDRRSPDYFETRYLDASPGTASGKIVEELLAMCEAQGLFEKAEQEERARLADQQRRDDLRGQLYFQRAAGVQLFAALEHMVEKFSQLGEDKLSLGQMGALSEARLALSIGRGSNRREFLCRPKARPDHARQGVYASTADQATIEYVLGSAPRGTLPDEVDVIEGSRD